MAAHNFCQMLARVGDRELVETALPARHVACALNLCALMLISGVSSAAKALLASQYRHYAGPLISSRNISKARRSLRNFSPSLSLPLSSPSIPSLSLSSAHCPAQSTATRRYLIIALRSHLEARQPPHSFNSAFSIQQHHTCSAQPQLTLFFGLFVSQPVTSSVAIFGITPQRETIN
jgi:hypothetical protein